MAAPKDFGVPSSVLHQLTVRYTGSAATPALAGMIVDWNGNIGTGQIMGVLVEDTSAGKDAGVVMAGIAEVLSNGVISVGQTVGTDGVGRGIVVSPGAQVLGRAMSGTTGPNQKFQVYITREGTN
jgi:hypothetical protein